MSSKLKSTKAVHALNLPYPEPSWPIITSSLEDALLDALIPLLLPIGAYRKESKPVTEKRRSRLGQKKQSTQVDEQVENKQQQTKPPTVQNKPAIQDHLTIGFNTTVRKLETLSQPLNATPPSQCENNGPVIRLTTILICIINLPSIMTNPLPLLAAMASRSGPQNDAIRIVPISDGGASRIAESLSQPRANILGILHGAPGSEALSTLIRENVEPIEIPWIRAAASHAYQPLKVYTEEVEISQAKARGEKRKREKE